MPGINKSSQIFALILCLITQYSAAVTVEDLYMAEVLVVGEDERQLKRGAQAGLLQVLVRASGTREVEQNNMIANSLRRPDEYYYQYSYEQTDKTLQIDGEAVPAKLLRILFEPSAVSRLLRQAGYPVWGSNRPGVLLWVAVSDDEGRRILAGSDTTGIATVVQSAMIDQARLRGVPLLFPLLDLEDAGSLSTAEIWGAFLGRIDNASRRYHPDVTVTARVQKDSIGRWSARWHYRADNEWYSVDTLSFNADQMARSIIDQLADELAQRFAIDSSRSEVRLRIEGIRNLQDYAAISEYLSSLAPVLDSSVTRLEKGEIEFSLSTEGQNEQLVEIIQLDEKMILLNADQDRKQLQYRWLPR